MADTLIIGGRTYTGVAGFKATDDNGVVQTFTKDGGGGGSDVEDRIIDRTISGSYVNSRVTTIGNYAFAYCSILTASFPVCTTIGSYAFAYCSIYTASFPVCTTIRNYAFVSCKLIAASFPACTTIGISAFSSCGVLATANFPACMSISSYAFNSCYSLNTVSFPACTTINSYAFSRCQLLVSAYFLGSSVPNLTNSNAFSSTPIAGYTTYTLGVYGSIYVRASLLTAFQSATNWSYFSSRIVGLTDAQIAEL